MNNGSVKKSNEPSSAIQDYLLALATEESAKKVAEKFSLSGDAAEVFLELLDDLVIGQLVLKDLPKTIADNFQAEKDRAAAIAVEFAGRLLLPIANEVGDVAGQIKVWGGEVEKFLKAPETRAASAASSGVITETLVKLGLQLDDPLLEKRLIFILDAYINGQRSDAETVAALTRSPKVGGLDFTPVEANQLLAAFQDKRKIQPKTMTDIKKPALPAAPLTSSSLKESLPSSPVKPAPPATKAPPIFPLGQALAEDEKEIIQAAAVIKERIAPAAAKPVTSIGEAAKRVEEESGLRLDETEGKKFLTIVEARLKEARDAFETRDALERPTGQGGFGLRGSQLVKVMESLEKIVGQWQAAAAADVGKAKEAAAAAKVADEAKKKQAAAAAQAARPRTPLRPIKPALSPASQPPSAGRPVVADIVGPSRKLAGPIDELGRLTIDEFRRLSRDPREAAIKIRDKIGLLEEQGVGQKILGIKAWRSSPVNRLYLEMARAALLASQAIEEVAETWGKDGRPTLSIEEIKAINNLNNETRF